ncbi:UPP1.2 family protein [Megaselia abdita]
MGMPSMSILLHEMIKLVTYAKCKDPIFIRLGTSGGVGVDPGTVVITDKAYNELLHNVHEFCILGKRVPREAVFDEETIKQLIACKSEEDSFDIVNGGTMGTNDFYEAQGRIDGAVCDYTQEDKLEFLYKVQAKGIKNIEMEAPMFAALTRHCGIRAADVCVTIINRLNGDQVSLSPELKHEFEMRPQIVVGRFIKELLSRE